MRLLPHHQLAKNLQGDFAWEVPRITTHSHKPARPIRIPWCLSSSSRPARPPHPQMISARTTLPMSDLPPSQALGEVFLPFSGAETSPVSHFSPPLDGASLPSLVTRPPPSSGSRANFIASLFIAFAGNLGRLKSSKADTNLQQTFPQKAHSFVITFLSPRESSKLAIISKWELTKTLFRWLQGSP